MCHWVFKDFMGSIQVHEIITYLERENFKLWIEKKLDPVIWELHMKTAGSY
jgi:hypothetical protein